MAKVRRKRRTYSNAKRISILQAARDQALTALDVEKRFGVTPVTYYSWRRKYGAVSHRVDGSRGLRSVGVAGDVRTEVQARVREMLPQIVRNEVSLYLDSLFGSSRGRGRKV